MRFWDSSAVLPLIVQESPTKELRELLADDRDVVVWWGTETECISALSRLERQKDIAPPQLAAALDLLGELAAAWHEVTPTTEVRDTAKRLLRIHPLTAADALQLAAAIVASEGDRGSLEIVTLDLRLRDAAERQGFARVLP
ncbi:MAG: type II toxin-antitoxin system VapC family toxin [Thermoanaerobaculia bacterium]